MSRVCIFCNSADNLDTCMDVKIDDVKYRVSVCKTHEDEASPGKIKEKVLQKISDFKKLQEAAAMLGYDLTKTNMSGSGLVIPTALPGGPVIPAPIHQPMMPAVPVDLTSAPQVELKPGITMAIQKDARSPDIYKLEVLAEERKRLEMQADFEAKSNLNYARPSTGDAPRYASHNLPDQIQLKDGRFAQKPQTFQTTKQVVRGRAGTPTAIPAVVDSSAGKTIITVKPTDEIALQKKWKYEAEMSKAMRDGFQGSFQGSAIPRDGYHENSECLMCSGTGRAKIGSGMCGRCSGTGYRGN